MTRRAMPTVNVLMTHAVDEEGLAIICRAHPSVQVAMVPYRETTEERSLRRAGRWQEVKQQPVSDELREALRAADVLFSLDLPTGAIEMLPRLRWVQNIGAGMEHLQNGGSGVWESRVVITNMGGPTSHSIAEFTLHLMLCHVKQTRELMKAQEQRRWIRGAGDTLSAKTAGILGLGRIGSEVARLSKAFDMRVIASRRTPPQERPPYVDALLGPDGLGTLLAESDFLVLSLPAVPDTVRIIGERELRLMKRTAMLINVGRGTLVDEGALVRALREGWIGAAGLDVFETEPLPMDSPLWGLPNVIVTPHTSASSPSYGLDVARFFAQNLQRFVAGKPLMNVVDKKKGY